MADDLMSDATAGPHGMAITLASCLFSMVLGTVHVFSVFLVPLETQFQASRSSVSLTYSLALIGITLAVLLGHRLYGRWPAARIVLGVAVLSAIGIVLTGLAGRLSLVWLGYGIIFGLANGLGYGFTLQLSAQANPGKEGLAMGLITAAYALGSVLAPVPFEVLMGWGGMRAAMFGLAATLIAVGCVVSWLLQRYDAHFTHKDGHEVAYRLAPSHLVLLWISYFGAVMAGLMVIGHVAGMAVLLVPDVPVWVALAVLASCNLAGSLIGGQAADWISARWLLSSVPALSLIALVLLVGTTGSVAFLILTGAVGFAYGAAISAYPPVIAKKVGPQASALIYGRVFTAWGAAGLAGPWLAGWLYDLSGAYTTALLTAACCAGLSVFMAAFVFQKFVGGSDVQAAPGR